MADAAGAVLAAAVRAVGLLRRSPRPLHPRGVVHRGMLLIDDAGAPGGRELGAPAVVPALVRVSRSAGLPAPLPDVGGLAVRWWRDGEPQDVLLSSTGPGGAWRRCGRLTCPPAADAGDDDALRFDPVRHAPMTVPVWAARLRRRSYRIARERGTGAPPPQRALSPAP